LCDKSWFPTQATACQVVGYHFLGFMSNYRRLFNMKFYNYTTQPFID